MRQVSEVCSDSRKAVLTGFLSWFILVNWLTYWLSCCSNGAPILIIFITTIANVSKSTLSLQLLHTLFQMKLFPIGTASDISVLMGLPLSLGKISELLLQSWGQRKQPLE